MQARFRLKKRKDIEYVLQHGRRISFTGLRVSFLPNHTGHPRIAVIVPKAVDRRAVKRNNIRRKTQEWFERIIAKEPDVTPQDATFFFFKEVGLLSKEKFYELLEKFKKIFINRG